MTTLPQTTSSIQLPRPAGPAPIATVPPPGGQMGMAAASPMTGSDVWRVIRTNMWMILICGAIGIVAGFGLNMFLSAFYARYTATGYIKIESSRANLLQSRDEESMIDPAQSLIVEQRTQAQILMTNSLFARVLTDANSKIQETQWLKEFRMADGTVNVPEAKEDLARKFSASPIGDSRLIAVSFSYRVPEDCRTVVMEIVEKHLENQRKQSTDTLVQNIDVVTNLKNRYEALANQRRTETSNIAATLQLDGMGRPGFVGQKEQELQTLTLKRLEMAESASMAKSSYENAAQEIAQGGTPGYVEMMLDQNWEIINLRQMLSQITIQLNSLPFQGPDSRYRATLQSQFDAAEKQLNERLAEKRATLGDGYLSQLGGQAQAMASGVEAMNAQILKLQQDLADMGAKLADYLTKKDEEEAYRELARRYVDQLDRWNVTRTRIDMATVQWMSQPETPDVPSFPKLPVTLAVCIAASLGLSLGFAFLREMLDTSVRSPRDIARVGQLTLLGMIPHEDDDPQIQGVPLATVIYGAPGSMMAEQFRQVRTRLQHAASLDTTRSIMVTSPGPGDGKSVIACNLAAGLALNGRRILLVDANFRRPELHKLFDMDNTAGFGNVLASVANFEACIRQTKVPNLDLMTAGPRPGNATELLESQLLIDFIERSLEEYDHIIFDTGPMLVVSETVALAPRVDGVITVVRASTNSRGLLQRMRDALKQLKAEHLGVVLNGVRTTAGGYYGRNIKAYYEYQNGHAQ